MSCEGCKFWSAQVLVSIEGRPDQRMCLFEIGDGIPAQVWDQRMRWEGCDAREEGPAVDAVPVIDFEAADAELQAKLERDAPVGTPSFIWARRLRQIDIVFSGGGPDLQFVEVEDGDGHSIRIGEWIQRDGFHVLRIWTPVTPPSDSETPTPEAPPDERTD